MVQLAEWVFLALTTIQFILGHLGNGFIAFLNGNSWFKNKRISLSDFIITNLALSRIVLLWIIWTDGLLIVFSYKMHEQGTIMQIIDIFWTFVNHVSVWLITCLSVLYCLKIASLSHSTFLWLKHRVSRVVVWMLLGALLLSCGSTLCLINEFKIYFALSKNNATRNVTENTREKRSGYNLTHVLATLWYLPPLIVSLISYVLLILSLRMHMRQMQQNGTSCSDQSSEAHKRAARIILSFFLLFLLYFISFLVLSSSSFLPRIKLTKMIGEVVTMFYPVGHSFVLILGNTKLKQAFLAKFPCPSGDLKLGAKGPFPP
ncbi:taste receptor type 2 member 3 [Ctenodactylus gundi]